MAAKRDYYEILGVDRNSGEDDIKRAFRKLAFQCHPDRNHGNPEAEGHFKELNEAYEVLCDPQKRANYDRFGTADVNGSFSGFDPFNLGGLGEIFESFFGGTTTRDRRSPREGADLRVKLDISFEDAVFGAEREVEIQRTEICETCRGIGSEAGTNPVKCTGCNGQGQVRRTQQNVFGQFVNIVTCPRCKGEGTVVTNPCPSCKGMGRATAKRKLKVGVPAGIDHGYQLRLDGEGEAGLYGGPTGDLFVVVAVKPHPYFKREGNSVIYELPLNIVQATLGDEVEVPTVHGLASLKVSPATQFGQVYKLKGKGIPRLDGRGTGDQLVVIKIVTPDRLDEKQRQALEELGKTLAKPRNQAEEDTRLIKGKKQ